MARSDAEVAEIAAKAVAEARRHIPVTDAVIFGSYVDGTPHEWSDIDLAIFTPAADAWTRQARHAVNRAIRKAVDLAVEVHFFGMKAKENARPSNFAGYVLTHGKRIA